MSNLVENPILNNAFLEPTRYHLFEPNKEPVEVKGRRPAQYLMARRSREGRAQMIVHEYRNLETVNLIRDRVKKWRESDYPGASRITRELLIHWKSPERDKKFFFCQLEAVETIIWLVEAPPSEKSGIEIKNTDPYIRWCLKMATGSGKTVVMAMLIAWSILNKVTDRQNPNYSDAILVVCPNLTIKDRLQVLYPEREGGSTGESYYAKFDIVPSNLRALLTQGKVYVTNWHAFTLQDDTKKRGVVNRGVESDAAFCDRVLEELQGKNNLLVLNDEAHHAYRITASEKQEEDLLGEELESDFSDKEEEERARVWIEGLDRIQKVRGIRRVIDLSATPYFLKSSGRLEGEPFDWIVSDFGLLDSIESGIVKVPHIPVWDDRGQKVPKYLKLYQEVKDKLPRSEKELSEGGRSIALVEEIQGALTTLAGQWKEDLKKWQGAGLPVPPAMIIVCHNTAVSGLIAKFIGDEGKVDPELKNTNGEMRTLRIDSKLLKDAEIREINQTQEQAAERLRMVVSTVGKHVWPGGRPPAGYEGTLEPPGKKIRCVVSVGMLSEGWDAQNVTQILGLRAFSSPLLCEQVIGRGLRRYNYDDLSVPEYVDIYGIPFEVLPMAKVGALPDGGKPPTFVKSIPEREKDYGLSFPCVVGYIREVKYKIRVEWDRLPVLEITPSDEPTETGVAGMLEGKTMPREFHDRSSWYENNRLQKTFFEIAGRITESLQNRILFPQVLKAVREYYETKVKYKGEIDPREFCLEHYVNLATQSLSNAIRSDDDRDEDKFLPILDPYRPVGSTTGIFFQTSLFCIPTIKSHISHIACHSEVWERDIAVKLENPKNKIKSYVRNYKLGFGIPYDWAGGTHAYIPDFIVQLIKDDGSTLNLVLEVKGLEGNVDRLKEAAAYKWVSAVNTWGKLGKWDFAVVKDLTLLEGILAQKRSA